MQILGVLQSNDKRFITYLYLFIKLFGTLKECSMLYLSKDLHVFLVQRVLDLDRFSAHLCAFCLV